MIKRAFWASAILLIFFFTQCHKAQTNGLFTQSDPSALAVFTTDTFSVVTSTVALDSVPTFNVGVYNDSTIMVGRAVDPYLGALTANSYFQILATNNGNKWDLSPYNVNDQIRFDSIELYLKYNNVNPRYEDFGQYQGKKQFAPKNTYYQTYGDTTKKMTLQVHLLNKGLVQNPVFNNTFTGGITAPFFYVELLKTSPPQGLFNTSKGSFNPDSVYASVNFFPHPRSLPDSLIVRLPDTLGKNLIHFALNNDPRISTDLNFINYFRGFALTVPKTTNGSILSFDPRLSRIKLYYKQNIDGVFINQSHYFSINYLPNGSIFLNNTLFNQIAADRTITPLAGLKPFTSLKPTIKNGNFTYVQSGSGLLTKIEFPYLQAFFSSHSKLVVNRAELLIENNPNTYSPGFRLPPYLQLYINNITNLNIPIGLLSQDFVPFTAQTALRQNIGGPQFGYYQFYITQFFGSQVYKPFYDGTALFLGTPAASMENSCDRLILNNPLTNNNSIKLRVSFTQTNLTN